MSTRNVHPTLKVLVSVCVFAASPLQVKGDLAETPNTAKVRWGNPVESNVDDTVGSLLVFELPRGQVTVQFIDGVLCREVYQSCGPVNLGWNRFKQPPGWTREDVRTFLRWNQGVSHWNLPRDTPLPAPWRDLPTQFLPLIAADLKKGWSNAGGYCLVREDRQAVAVVSYAQDRPGICTGVTVLSGLMVELVRRHDQLQEKLRKDAEEHPCPPGSEGLYSDGSGVEHLTDANREKVAAITGHRQSASKPGLPPPGKSPP